MENAGSDASEGRIAALEKKVIEMEALVDGFTRELLDLKAVNRGLSKHSKDQNPQEPKSPQIIVQGSPVRDAVAVDETAPQQQDSNTVLVRSGLRAEDPDTPADDRKWS